jgi:NADH-quinone oxidoreductase subunit H
MSLDPLFAHGVHWPEVVIALVRVVIGFGALMGTVVMMIWFERKVISDMQARIGPNRAGPFGLLQTLADGIKLFFKEDLVPERADRFVFKLAPYLSLVPALIAFTIVPVGGIMSVAGHHFEVQVADPPIGILLLLAMSSISVYGVMLAGWSSGSKYPLLGSVRASAQMISYEAAMGMSVVTVVLLAGTLSTRGIVDAQATTFFASWGFVRTGVVPFLIFLVAVTAETNRPPFDLVEADSELVGGFNTEYSSIRFALFYMAEFMNTITMSAVIVTLFFGGPDGPTPHIMVLDQLVPIAWFLGKTGIFLFAYVWFRAALPRLRYDQLMDLGWKVLIPLSLVWLLIVAGALVNDWWVVGLAAALVVGAVLLGRALGVGRFRADAGLLGEPGSPMARPVVPAARVVPAVPRVLGATGSPSVPAGSVGSAGGLGSAGGAAVTAPSDATVGGER